MKTPLIRLLLFAAFGPLAALHAQSNYATPYTFTTLAGDVGYGSADGARLIARFHGPRGIAVDSSGNVYVADTLNNTIRKIASDGAVTTLAGSPGISGAADGTGAGARFAQPEGIAVDGVGNVYVADTSNSTIRKITGSGVVTTVAGLAQDPGSADGPAADARFSYPSGLAVDNVGNIYVADTGNRTIRKITAGGTVTTLAGLAGSSATLDGTGSAARFYLPHGVAVDVSGNVYVADVYTIRKISTGGAVTTLAGAGNSPGGDDGVGSNARFAYATGVSVDSSGNVYVADTNRSTIRMVYPFGLVTTLAGDADGGLPGSVDGSGTAARFYFPFAVATSDSGALYVADTSNNTIRKITAGTQVTTFAGVSSIGTADGLAASAHFNRPRGMAVDAAGNVYIADSWNSTIRKISAGGIVSTLAGTANSSGHVDGVGSNARFAWPAGIAVDGAGNLYVADSATAMIRKITGAGVVTTIGGATPTGGNTGEFDRPGGVAVDAAGDVYVADTGDQTIRKLPIGGTWIILAGMSGVSGFADGPSGSALFNYPTGVAVNSDGNVYVADSYNNAIRKITPAGVVTTLAGSPETWGKEDGIGSSARFALPDGIAINPAGELFVSDTVYGSIRKITQAGEVTTLAGATEEPFESGSADGTGSTVRFYSLAGIAVTPSGDVYVADSFNNTIRKGFPGIIANDLNGDGKADILWRNTVTGQFCVWLMDGTSYLNWVDFGLQSTDWHVAVTGAFNADGKTDIMWENLVTGDRGFWLMNGPTFASWVDIGVIPTAWRVAAAADLNADGKTDLIWENTVTGERYFWYMNGTTVTGAALLATVSTDWHIVAAADFDGDGKPDILWENTVTGDHYYWFMNNTTITGALFMGNFGTQWHLAAVADYNADGKPDILWENRTTGDRYLWFMNGTDITSAILVGNVSTDWQIVH